MFDLSFKISIKRPFGSRRLNLSSLPMYPSVLKNPKLNKSGANVGQIFVKEFYGNEELATDYALIESNRSGTPEGIESDIKAYKRMIQRGMSKDKQLSIFKTKGYIETLRRLSLLDPKGEFIQRLKNKSKKSFAYLERNACWVGELIEKYQLTKKHEKELFLYLYSANDKDKDGKIKISKQGFFKKVASRAEAPNFDANKPLNLSKPTALERLHKADPIKIRFGQIQSNLNNHNAHLHQMIRKLSRKIHNKASEKEIKMLENEIQHFLQKRLIPDHLQHIAFTEKVEDELKRMNKKENQLF